MRVATPVTAPKAWARRLKVGEGLKGFVENAVFWG